MYMYMQFLIHFFLFFVLDMLQQATEGGGRDKIRERIFEEFREKYPGLPDDELRVKMRADMAQRMVEVREKESAITGITLEVEELQRRNQKAFSIPEWFLYTSRAFLTLEGISLQANEDYSLIKSCFPYVAKRLLNDDSERAQTALRDLLYGAGQYVSGDRLLDLTEGFSTYVATTKTKNIRPSKIIDAGLKVSCIMCIYILLQRLKCTDIFYVLPIE